MEIKSAQTELRQAYVKGGPGAIISGLVWLAAGTTLSFSNISWGFAVLFFGGMLIFPIAKLSIHLMYRRPQESKNNPGGLIVVETIFPMIGGLFAAWLIMPHRPEFVFPVAAIAVGAHYFGFRTAYGDWTYWLFGTAIVGVGVCGILIQLPSLGVVPISVAVIEFVFGLWFVLTDRNEQAGHASHADTI